MKKSFILAVTVSFAACTGGVGTMADAFPDVEYRTRGELAESPILVGTWVPMQSETPRWIFPMVYAFWRNPFSTPEEYADAIVAEIKSRPPDQPIWLQTQRWFGRYRPVYDDENIFSHRADVTRGGTPGIWPEQGVEYWLDLHERFLKRIKVAGCRIDYWPLDNETHIVAGSSNFNQPWTFRNVVTDPRWRTRPIYGLGITGSQLLDPDELQNEQTEYRKPKTDAPDSRLAVEACEVLGQFVGPAIKHQIFAQTFLKYYPDALVSNYRSHWLTIPWNDVEELKLFHGSPELWRRLLKICPDLKRIPMVGNCSAPPFYGQDWHFAQHTKHKPDRVAAMLEEADWQIAHLGDPALLTPWITLPHNKVGDMQKRTLSRADYERLILGLANRGVRKFIVWNSSKDHQDPAGEREMLEVLEKAYRAAKERIERSQDGK